jgi:uncharacterized protein YycO
MNWYRKQLENEYGVEVVNWAVSQVSGPFTYAFIDFCIKEQGSGSEHDILGYAIKKQHIIAHRGKKRS